MTAHYVTFWDVLHGTEGASQRVQEDTLKLAALLESLGVGFVRAVMTLIAFVPILWGLSEGISLFGIPHVLVVGAIVFALVGTIGLDSSRAASLRVSSWTRWLAPSVPCKTSQNVT